MKRRYILLLFISTILLLYIPYIGDFLGILNTLFHEFGHAFMTIITGGKVQSISLNIDGSGLTKSLSSRFFLIGILISIAGYTSVPIITYCLSWLWKKDKQLIIMIFIFATTFISLIFFIRNWYGVIWSILSIVILFLCLKAKNKGLLRVANLMMINLLVASSFTSTMTILIISWNTPNKAGDATALQNITLIPSIVWSLFFVVFNLFMSYLTLKIIFKNVNKNEKRITNE